MLSRNFNTLLVLVVTLVVLGAGYYQTEVHQPNELQHLEDGKKVARLQQAELEQLFAEESVSVEQAEEATRRWRARYKIIPSELTTPEIIQYLERLSASGFEQFKYRLTNQGTTPDFGYYLFEISGTAFYESLYQFIWQIENNREFFYQVNDLDLSHTNVFKKNATTGLPRRLDMVDFSMTLKVFFAGTEGLSAPQDMRVEVPEGLLPATALPHDSFYPIVRTDLPPNDELLVDIENDYLLSIVGDRVVFENKYGQHILQEGDKVYLGQIVKIDPARAIVRASLNKGGVIEVVDVQLNMDYRRPALENTRRVPINNN